MSTNALIGIRENNTVTYIYNHSDGYLEYLGWMLVNYYNSKEKTKTLISLGDVSVVKEKLAPEEGTVHTFDNRQEDVSVFYHRDRNENWMDNEPQTVTYSPNTPKKDITFDDPYFYNYLYDVEDGTWLFTCNGKTFTTITKNNIDTVATKFRAELENEDY